LQGKVFFCLAEQDPFSAPFPLYQAPRKRYCQKTIFRDLKFYRKIVFDQNFFLGPISAFCYPHIDPFEETKFPTLFSDFFAFLGPKYSFPQKNQRSTPPRAAPIFLLMRFMIVFL
jgi:hypothetical protein